MPSERVIIGGSILEVGNNSVNGQPEVVMRIDGVGSATARIPIAHETARTLARHLYCHVVITIEAQED